MAKTKISWQWFRIVCKVKGHDWYQVDCFAWTKGKTHICLRCRKGTRCREDPSKGGWLNRSHWFTYNRAFRWVLRKLPNWEWCLDLLYPDDLKVTFK